MSPEDEERATTGENLWAILDMDGKVIKGGFESEEAGEIWTTTDDGKQAVEKAGGTFTVEELSSEDFRAEEDEA
ncbi:MAG: hypothetical protein A2945_01030 [Candidatus Liptonbacteria bacterium RIFCSPLOWO2_01_FULL_52_25]|uniref:Uncharacterized protein n=1 Tax=Candidatus Liptonbacteria bacterium RIFCSPLOWO2_01_FULL_52_25 TaxID=1798650 RepID=A0A1G2CDG1_9BACT|nr:MAG: hypothetical protein A2945_01030 [Candidatus Liptonbacteria bacterium RIFCSPLOWO2_01_FULL_52_25]